jgi:hypothetical protein
MFPNVIISVLKLYFFSDSSHPVRVTERGFSVSTRLNVDSVNPQTTECGYSRPWKDHF